MAPSVHARVELPPPEAVDALEADALPGFLAQLAALALRGAARLAVARSDHKERTPTEQGALTQEQASEAYRIPLRTIRRLTRTKRVPSYFAGRNRMIRPADLDRYLARCRDQGVSVGALLDV